MTAHPTVRTPVLTVGAVLAVSVPSLLGFSAPPSTTFFNQAASVIAWGLFCFVVAGSLTRSLATVWRPGAAAACAAAGLSILLCMALLATGVGLPSALALSSAGFVAAALVVLLVAGAARSTPDPDAAFEAFCTALVVAGLVSLVIATIQYFVPAWTDGDWLARPASPGRVGANLRQPNHLSTLLLWALAATVWLHGVWARRGVMPVSALRVLTAAVLAGLTFGAVLTVSRTGSVCIVLLGLWGLLDKRLPRFVRVALWLLPLFYVLCWFGVTEWASATQHAFAGESQLNKGDLSSSRFKIWSNSWDLIRANPWWGVGWGEFNFAWTLTPFPGRPVAFFDHTHNLPLQLAVEIGIPLATLVMGLFVAALAMGWRQMQRLDGDRRNTAACALVMVLMIGLHSQLEYPLWYAYFLLPSAFALGTFLGRPPTDLARVAATTEASAPPRALPVFLMAASALVTVGGTAALVDYQRVVQIFAPGDDAAPLEQRIADGRRSWFFAHHADYAAVTTAARPSDAMASFASAPHYLLDARLMIAWSKALAEQGDLQRARFVAQRLKEFNHPLGDEFFAPCTATLGATSAAEAADLSRPFQCTAPTQAFGFRDFR